MQTLSKLQSRMEELAMAVEVADLKTRRPQRVDAFEHCSLVMMMICKYVERHRLNGGHITTASF